MAPKFKHFGATMTLTTRVCVAVGIHNMGIKGFYNGVFHTLGMNDDDYYQPIQHAIDRLHCNKTTSSQRKSSLEYKRKRTHQPDALKWEQVAQKRREVVQGTYQSGIGLIDYTDIDSDKATHPSEHKKNHDTPTTMYPSTRMKYGVTPKGNKWILWLQWWRKWVHQFY